MGEKKFLEQINAIVSHEMKNPLNAILSMIARIKLKVKHIKKSLNDPAIPGGVLLKLHADVDVIESSIPVLESSSKKLNFTVNDMLSLAQLEKDKFRINLSTFDIKEAVAEVMSIQ